MTTESVLVSVDEDCRRRFEQAWRAGQPLPIEACLPAATAPLFLATLEELVVIDLEFRARNKGGSPPRLEEYLRRFPALAEPALLRRLLREEWRVRRRWGETPAAEEYGDRFPQLTIPASLGDQTRPNVGGPGAAPLIPGYEVLEELGRGGMGVVYKARHIGLNRVVALKMILRGGQAGSEERARFLAEAEAVAQLQHPNIVQVFEVGQHQESPYMALEFAAGGSLNARLKEGSLQPRDAAELVAQLARGVAAAHAAGIVHRDLKPHNVLLAPRSASPDSQAGTASPAEPPFRVGDFTPKITDFGLAKKVEGGSGLTQSGVMIGTPSYMAPEQAGLASPGRKPGESVVGPAADVYALGAILYQCLTGRPPFVGPSPLETALLVVAEDPVPVRQLQPKAPLDLETICHKCMQKEPQRRYASAQALADELGRFLRGEPVQARPVGGLERGWRWCRRQPALAAASAAAVLFLVGGALVASWFAVDANRQADEVRRTNGDLDRKNSELERSQEQLEGMLARTWLAPLSPRAGPLAEPEARALEQVAGRRGQPLVLRFVREGLTDPKLTPKLAVRSEYVWQAALGLDRKQRREAERLVLAGLRSAPQQGERFGLAVVAAALGDLSPETARLAAAPLTQAMTEITAPAMLERLALALSAVVAHLEPNEAASVCAPGATALIQAISKTLDPRAMQTLTLGLVALADRLEPREAAAAAAALIQAMTRTTLPDALQSLARGLAAVAVRLEPRKVAEAAATLIQAMTRTTDSDTLRNLARGLEAVAARLESRKAAEVAATLLQAMTRATSPLVLLTLAEGLSVVAVRMEPREATALCGQAATLLLPLLTTTTDQGANWSLPQLLSMLAVRMEPKEAATVHSRAATLLTQAMPRPTKLMPLLSLVQRLAPVAAGLEPKEAAEAAAAILQAMTRTTDSGTLRNLAKGLAMVAARMEPREAAKMCGQAATLLTQTLTRTTDRTTDLFGLQYLAEELLSVVAWMEPREAAKMCGQAATLLTQTLTSTTDPKRVYPLAQSLAMVATRMEPKEAATKCGQAATTLTQMMTRTTDPNGLSALATGLSVLAARMEPKEAATLCRRAATLFTQLMTTTPNPFSLPILAHGLSAVAVGLDPKEAAAAAAAILQAMTRRADPGGLQSLAGVLSVVVARMEPKAAAAVCRQAVALLTEAMTRTTDEFAASSLATGFPALTARLEAREVTEAAAMLLQAMTRTTYQNNFSSLAETLAAVLRREESRPFPPPRQLTVVSTIGGVSGPWSLLAIPAVLQPALAPVPPPLPAQLLVDLLKESLCVGKARHLVLEQLGRHYGRPFADQWDFGRFAEEQQLNLDLLSPPPRSPLPQVGVRAGH